MNPERLTPSDIKKLVLSEGPAITLVVAANTNGDQRIHLKGELQRLRGEAQSSAGGVQELLDSIQVPAGNNSGPTAFLRSPSVSITMRVDPCVKPTSRVGKYFDIRTLLSIANCQKTFYVVALSQNRARILECTESSSKEIPFPAGFPTSLADFLQTKKPDHVLDSRNSAGPSVGSMAGVMSGTSTDREAKDEYLLHYFRSLDRAVNVALKGQTAALIPVGVEHELALYRRVNTYSHLIDTGVHGSPDGLDGRELHTRALELLSNDPKDPQRVLLADYEKRVGTGHASAKVHEIIAAAHEGRVSHLCFQESAHYDGTFDGARQKIKHHTDSLDATEDLIDKAAYETLLHGGEVMLLPGRLMPKGVPVCALFRYPAVEAPEEETMASASNSRNP